MIYDRPVDAIYLIVDLTICLIPILFLSIKAVETSRFTRIMHNDLASAVLKVTRNLCDSS